MKRVIIFASHNFMKIYWLIHAKYQFSWSLLVKEYLDASIKCKSSVDDKNKELRIVLHN